MAIKSPYNFVPLCEQVFSPAWAARISQEIPFSDGISGKIRLHIKAASPIFVTDAAEGLAEAKARREERTVHTFCKAPDGRYYIPGTGIKGAVRNVLTILSNGRMRVQKSLDFAQREWDNKKLYPLKEAQNNMRCGWLRWNRKDGYHIVDCGKPYRVGHDKLDAYLASWSKSDEHSFEKYFKKASSGPLADERKRLGYNLTKPYKLSGKNLDPKSAEFKYRMVGDLPLDVCYEVYNEDQRRVNISPTESGNSYRGTIVFTGQPDQWVYPRPKNVDSRAGKFYEFVFKSPEQTDRIIPISDEKFEEYQTIYKDSSDWQFWADKLYEGGIPVFFIEDKIADKEGRLKWGLARLFKLPYDNTPFESLPEAHRREEPDMADCIFGYAAEGPSKESLRGRVSVGHAFCVDGTARELAARELVLGNPKASYYPLYVAQQGRNGKDAAYRTYNDGTPAGWKRYMVKKSAFVSSVESENKNIATQIMPLAAGAEFESVVRFHNLRPAELGALLSALTFHGREDCFYQLGQAKPYGYGKVRFSVALEPTLPADAPTAIDHYLQAFEQLLWQNDFIVGDAYLTEIARTEVEGEAYDYMKMSNTQDDNEFNKAKKNKEYLPRFREASAEHRIADALKRRANDRSKREAERLRLEREQEAQLAAKRAEAEQCYDRKEYQQALTLFEELTALGDNANYTLRMEVCRDEIRKAKVKETQGEALASVPFDDWLAGRKVSSIKAFTGQFKKWHQAQGRNLSVDEMTMMAEHLRKAYAGQKASTKKEWRKAGSWKELNALVGSDLSELFN